MVVPVIIINEINTAISGMYSGVLLLKTTVGGSVEKEYTIDIPSNQRIAFTTTSGVKIKASNLVAEDGVIKDANGDVVNASGLFVDPHGSIVNSVWLSSRGLILNNSETSVTPNSEILSVGGLTLNDDIVVDASGLSVDNSNIVIDVDGSGAFTYVSDVQIYANGSAVIADGSGNPITIPSSRVGVLISNSTLGIVETSSVETIAPTVYNYGRVAIEEQNNLKVKFSNISVKGTGDYTSRSKADQYLLLQTSIARVFENLGFDSVKCVCDEITCFCTYCIRNITNIDYRLYLPLNELNGLNFDSDVSGDLVKELLRIKLKEQGFSYVLNQLNISLDSSGALLLDAKLDYTLKCVYTNIGYELSGDIVTFSDPSGLVYKDEYDVAKTVSPAEVFGTDLSGAVLFPNSVLDFQNKLNAFFKNLGYTGVECVCESNVCICKYCKKIINSNLPNYVVSDVDIDAENNVLSFKVKNDSPNSFINSNLTTLRAMIFPLSNVPVKHVYEDYKGERLPIKVVDNDGTPYWLDYKTVPKIVGGVGSTQNHGANILLPGLGAGLEQEVKVDARSVGFSATNKYAIYIDGPGGQIFNSNYFNVASGSILESDETDNVVIFTLPESTVTSSSIQLLQEVGTPQWVLHSKTGGKMGEKIEAPYDKSFIKRIL